MLSFLGSIHKISKKRRKDEDIFSFFINFVTWMMDFTQSPQKGWERRGNMMIGFT